MMTPAFTFLLGALFSPVAIYWVAVVRGRARVMALRKQGWEW